MEPRKKHRFRRKRTVFGCLIGVAALVLCLYFTGFVFFHGRFLPNTQINGISCSFLTAAEAEECIAAQVEDYAVCLKERGEREEIIEGKQIGYVYRSGGEVEVFLHAQKCGLWFVSWFRSASLSFSTSAGYDASLLSSCVDDLTCFDEEVEEEPTDASMVFRSTKFVIEPEQQGCKVEKERLTEALADAVERGAGTLDLEEAGCYAVPAVTADDAALNALVENMNHYADISITYCFGDEKEVLNGRILKDWLTYDENGKVTVKDGCVADYVAFLAEKYDTSEKPREFLTSDGTYVTVEGGSYGWKLDQEAETEALTLLLEEEPHTERTPVYEQEARSRENSDLGDSYVEVDLSRQHLWMYVDGALVVESDLVSGKMTKDRITPPGTYQITYKKSPAVLHGEDYESDVTFWMPFNGSIGLHDSSWRSSYGGEIFWKNGSHGCINLPYQAAKTIYENIETGFPVICYYRGDEYESVTG